MMIKRGASILIEKVECGVFEVSGQAPEKKSERGREELATLLPPLTDELVLTQIWPRLHKRVNVSLLWRLRRVNKVWREKVNLTLEWSALELVRVDSMGFLRLISERGERRPPLRERVESELKFLALLLDEDLEKFAAESSRTGIVGQGSLLGVKAFESRVPVLDEFEAETSSSSCEVCGRADWVYLGGISRERGEETEDERFEENSVSSSDSSMSVWYPRHFRRI